MPTASVGHVHVPIVEGLVGETLIASRPNFITTSPGTFVNCSSSDFSFKFPICMDVVCDGLLYLGHLSPYLWWNTLFDF